VHDIKKEVCSVPNGRPEKQFGPSGGTRCNSTEPSATARLLLGPLVTTKTEAEAQKAADALRLEINDQTPRQLLQSITIETLIEHYRQHELPDIVTARGPWAAKPGKMRHARRSQHRQPIKAISRSGFFHVGDHTDCRREGSSG